MRRLVFEADYAPAWRQIFGRNSDSVQVLEVTRCLRCDSAGVTLICRVELNKRIKDPKQLLSGGNVTELETLYRGKDGSATIFIEAHWNPGFLKGNWPPTKILQRAAPEFIDPNRMKVEFVGNETEVQKVMEVAEKSKYPYKILGLTSLDPRPRKILSRLTPKQRQILLAAFNLGYYDVPRRVSSEEVAERLKIHKTTLVEHLRKAERRILTSVLAE